jgi:hypothetical protein
LTFFQLLSFVSGLAYLALCLLIAVFRARKECPRESLFGNASTIGPSAEKNGRRFLWSLSASCALSSFLFMPCGTLPSLLSVSGGALAAIGVLALALVFQGGRERAGKWAHRSACVPFSLAVSLAAIAHYARQRGVPGELYALDAYVATPLTSVTDAWEKSGLYALAVASLLALYGALPTRRLPTHEGKSPKADEDFLAALTAELWILATVAFWVCLFFPHSLAYDQVSEISVLGGLALNALIFWGKVLGLKWLLRRLREKWPYDLPFHTLALFVLSGIGAWLLLLDTPVA